MENDDDIQLLSGSPLDLLTSEIEPTLNVKCADLTGILFTDNFSGSRECISCIHGLVRPIVFEKLAGKGSSKNWRKTIRNAETGVHLYSMIQSGQLIILDEKRRNTKIKNKSENNMITDQVGQIEKKKRKRGRPKKCFITDLNKDSKTYSCNSELGPHVDHQSNSCSLEIPKVENQSNDTVKRKRKKISIVASKSKCSMNNSITAAKQLTLLDNKSGDSDADTLKKFDESKRVVRSNRCKPIKRTRCNHFERGLNTIPLYKTAHKLNIIICRQCGTKVSDASALKYHDMLFHESISRNLYFDSPFQISDCIASSPIGDGKLDPASFSSDLTDSLSMSSSNNVASLDVFGDKLTRGTVAKLASIGMQEPLVPTNLDNVPGPSEISTISSDENQKEGSISSDPDELNISALLQDPKKSIPLLAQLSNQYQEILGLSKETLQQTNILNNRMHALTKVVQEIRSDVIGISKSMSKDKKSKLINGIVNGVDDHTLSKIFDTFMNGEKITR